MEQLIEDNIENGAAVRTAAAIAETAAGDPVAAAGETQKPDPRAGSKRASSSDPAESAAAADPVRVASIGPEVPYEKPRPAYVSGAPKQQPADARAAANENNSKGAARDGSTTRSGLAAGAAATTTPTALRAGGTPKNHAAEKTLTAMLEPTRSETVTAADAHRPPAAAHTGWMIQIGATDDIGKATALLARAKSEGTRALTSAQPFTEKVQKGSETLYRARFAGLQAESAELACKALKRSGFSCFATRN
jgi:D-alanyl-D-alanine carboxypeptidase